jgi:predicted transcriptional regulator YdeE
MITELINEFYVIGIAVRTSNENGQSGIDIPKLWEAFIGENMIDQIPNKLNSTIYCMYTDYEKDHTRPYTTILGCRVENLTDIPENMVGKTVERANYTKYIAKGNLAEGVVFSQWVKIWDADLPRAFTTDFEVYGEKAQNSQQAEVEIFIAL